MGKKSLTPTEQYRTDLTRLNKGIEALSTLGRVVQAHDIKFLMDSELLPRPDQQVASWERERLDREQLAGLPPERLAKIRGLLADRAHVIRTLQLTDAEESRPKLEDEFGPIAWDAPALDLALARLCDAIDWHREGVDDYEGAASQLYDSLRGGWAFDQFTARCAAAIYHGFVWQVDESQLAALRAELFDAKAKTSLAAVRNGFDLLRHIVEDAASELLASRCPVCGNRRGRHSGLGEETGWFCFACDRHDSVLGE